MPICPVCKVNKPALTFDGTCSWACKGKFATSKPTAPSNLPKLPVVQPKPLTLQGFFKSQPTGTLVAARRDNQSKKLFYCQITAMNPRVIRPSVYLQDYLSRHKIQVKGKVIVKCPVNAWINMNSQLEQTLESQNQDAKW